MRRIRSNRVNSRSLAAIVVAAGIALGAPAGAIAQNVDPNTGVNPTDEEYDRGILGIAASGGPSGDPSAEASAGMGELPFTGLDVAAIAAIGIGLAGGGFVVRRAARSGNGAIS
jgi:hypothetical protein